MHQEEFESLMNAYGRDLYSFCCRTTRNKQEAEDLYQDTFLKLYEIRENVAITTNPKSFLMGISVNLYRNYKRKLFARQKITGIEYSIEETVIDIPSKEQLTEEQILMHEKYQILRDAVRGLPDKYRIPVLLFYMEELTIKEMAHILKLPEGTVKSRIHRAKKILKERLEKSFYE